MGVSVMKLYFIPISPERSITNQWAKDIEKKLKVKVHSVIESKLHDDTKYWGLVVEEKYLAAIHKEYSWEHITHFYKNEISLKTYIPAKRQICLK